MNKIIQVSFTTTNIFSIAVQICVTMSTIIVSVLIKVPSLYRNSVIFTETCYKWNFIVIKRVSQRSTILWKIKKNTNTVQLYNGNVLKKAILDKVTDMVAAWRKNVAKRDTSGHHLIDKFISSRHRSLRLMSLKKILPVLKNTAKERRTFSER